jgi:hypothetical protein
MTYTGNLIENLIATVEHVEQRTWSDEPLFVEHPLFTKHLDREHSGEETWFAPVQLNTGYDSKFIGVA